MGDKSPKSINKKVKQKQVKTEKTRKQKQQASVSVGTLNSPKRR